MGRDKILVVDDDKLIRDSLVELLEDNGCSAVGASNGQQAMDVLLTGNGTCLILLDLMMPVMDGRAFREEQVKREEIADIPVVLISAFGDLRNNARAMQVEGFLQKPLNVADILELVEKYCTCSAGEA
jgi:CheY-like chemotaxis protein